ncbi:MAG TPA: glycogen synthase GlgA [Rectinemataceae bacterium]|nr:glycogen synthase GlgA [Rectinemataceae bacterium]
MKILMVTSEALPFAKAGGLGDAVSALARALERAGHDVRIAMPRYYGVDKTNLEPLEGPLGVPVGIGEEWAAIYRATLPGSSVPVYFFEHERFFGRDGIYGDRWESDFADNPERFAFLSRAAFQLCRRLAWIPDILHAHDWPSSLVPVYLRHSERYSEFAKCASVLSIHNLGYQGLYSKRSYPYFGLPWELFHGAGFEYYDQVNLLKAGITNADCLTTVSPTYAREIQTPDFGFGLDGLLRYRSEDLVGILNGVDLSEWDPATDSFLPSTYSSDNMKGKAACKAALQHEFGLAVDPAKPLVGMVSRLADQKGVGELFGPLYGSAYNICAQMDLQFALVGSGERWCENEIRSLAGRLPNFRAIIGYDERLAHLIEAGSDFFMMPSRYEPCGLNQMYSLRYGTLPIVHRTGGLADTVENYNQETGLGTGFMFDQLTPRSIFDTTGWAVWAWYNRPAHIRAMRERAMSRRFSWDHSAQEYGKLYERALDSVWGRGKPGPERTVKDHPED